MRNPKTLLLAGILVLLAGVLVVRWVSGWGLVTLDCKDVPLAKVIKSIESQGRVKITTNADPATPVTIRMHRAPVFEAIDTLAVRIDGDARLAYVAAPDGRQITDVLAAFMAGSNPGGWAVFSYGGGPMSVGESVVDPRVTEWKVSDVPDKSLQAVLDQGAQKTGVLFAVPKAWNPVLGKLPAAGQTSQVAGRIIGAAKGQMKELVLLTVRPQRPEGQAAAEDGGRRWEMSRTVFSPQRGEGAGPGGIRGNPEWMAERIQSQIASLPVEERAEAQKQFDEMRAFWAAIRDLPEEERRKKIEEMMSNPEVQARMDERRESRDNKSAPEQRENRMRRYLDRKQQIKSKLNS